jgi:hypothetical protein
LRQNVEHVLLDKGDGSLPSLRVQASRPAEGPGDEGDAAVKLEFGGFTNYGYVAPRPFMTPALDRVEGYAVEVMGDTFGRNG